MPVIDTEVIFALNPKDSKHDHIFRLFESNIGLKVPDTSVYEFQLVLRNRGRGNDQIESALLQLSNIWELMDIREEKTIDTKLLIKAYSLQNKYELTYFDSLIAASTLALDSIVVSDDRSFDRILEIKRMPLSR